MISINKGIGHMKGSTGELFADWGTITTKLFEDGILKDLDMAMTCIRMAYVMSKKDGKHSEVKIERTEKSPGNCN